MSDAVQLALIASIAPTLAAFGALLVGILNGIKANAIIGKTDVIHTLTNNTLSELTKKYDVAIEKIAGLEKLLTARTARVTDVVNGAPSPTPLAVPVLAKIEANTAATALSVDALEKKLPATKKG